MHTRTGLRKPKQFLKMWADKDWTGRLTPRLCVGMVDEELPIDKEGGRKSWYLSVTQDTDLLETLGPAHGVPKQRKTLLLFEDDVVALVQHLLHRRLVVLDLDAGMVLNGPADDWDELKPLPAKAATKKAARKRARQKAR